MSFLIPSVYSGKSGLFRMGNTVFNRALGKSHVSRHFFTSVDHSMTTQSDAAKDVAQTAADRFAATANATAKQAALDPLLQEEQALQLRLPNMQQEYTGIQNTWVSAIKSKVSQNVRATHPAHRSELAGIAERTAKALVTRAEGTNPGEVSTEIGRALDAWAVKPAKLNTDAVHDTIKAELSKAEDAILETDVADDVARFVKDELDKPVPRDSKSIALSVYTRLSSSEGLFKLEHTPANNAHDKIVEILDNAVQAQNQQRLAAAQQAKHEIDTAISGDNWNAIVTKSNELYGTDGVQTRLNAIPGERRLLDHRFDTAAEEVTGTQVDLKKRGAGEWRANPKFSFSLSGIWHILPQRQIKAGTEFFQGYMRHGRDWEKFETAKRGNQTGDAYAQAQFTLMERFNNLLGRIRNNAGVNWNMDPSVALKGSKTLTADGLQHGENIATALEDPSVKPRMDALTRTRKVGTATFRDWALVDGRKKPNGKDVMKIRSQDHSFFHPGSSNPLSDTARIQLEEGKTPEERVASIIRGVKYAEGLAPARRAQVSPQIRLQNDVATERGEKIADTIETTIFTNGKATVDALAADGNGRVHLKAKKGSYSSAGGKSSTQLRVRQEGDKNRYGRQKIRYVRLNTQGRDLPDLETSATQALRFAENAAKQNPNISPNTMLSKAARDKGMMVATGDDRYKAFETAFQAKQDKVDSLKTSGVHLRALDANTIRIEAPHRWGVVGSILNPKHIFTRNASFNKVVRTYNDVNADSADNLVDAAIAKGNRLIGGGRTKSTSTSTSRMRY